MLYKPRSVGAGVRIHVQDRKNELRNKQLCRNPTGYDGIPAFESTFGNEAGRGCGGIHPGGALEPFHIRGDCEKSAIRLYKVICAHKVSPDFQSRQKCSRRRNTVVSPAATLSKSATGGSRRCS